MSLKHGDMAYKQWSHRKYVQRIPGNWKSYGYETATEWYTFGEPFRFRAEPVPDIHKYRNSPRGYYRHQRTTQELRWIEPHSEFVRIRGKRTKKHLPTWYDDRVIADNRQHGWKRTKKKRQWM